MITAAAGDAWVDLLALGTYFQALPLENDALSFACQKSGQRFGYA